MVRSPKSGRELGGETGDKAPRFLRQLIGHNSNSDSGSGSQKEFEIYTVEAPEHCRNDEWSMFECECDSERRVDEMTECKQCGAWYEFDGEGEPTMVQTAPPQFDV